MYLCPAPLYHSAPAGWSTTVHRLGGTVVAMHHFDAEACLAAIERYRVTHVQFVPTHLVRILKLDEDVRAKYDLSSLQVIVHAAAPCPPDVKRGAIEFFGPILHEYYAGSEGGGFCYINSEDWLAHPGSVGKPLLGRRARRRRGRQRAARTARRDSSGSSRRTASSTTATRRRRPRPGTTGAG